MSNTFARLSLLTTLTVALVAGGAVAVNAGEVEHSVIAEAAYAPYANTDSPSSEALRDAAIDMADIWADTEVGSYCEQYAATNFVLLNTLATATDPEMEGNVVAVISAQGLMPLIDELDAIGNRCLNER